MTLPTIVAFTSRDPETMRPSVAIRCHTCRDSGTPWAYTSLQTGHDGDVHAAELAIDHLVMVHDVELDDAERIVWREVAG